LKLYALPEVVTLPCPVPYCRAEAGVWCGISNRNPTAHERRIMAYQKSIYVPKHSSGVKAPIELVSGRHEYGKA